MKFKKIQFKNADAQKIYENYLKQIYSATKKLSNEDQNDILMELNSHIFENYNDIVIVSLLLINTFIRNIENKQ